MKFASPGGVLGEEAVEEPRDVAEGLVVHSPL
jgi:hypothetical protein